MNWGKTNQFLLLTVTTLFVVTGTYNAVVINSQSHLSESDVKFVKRLDEMYGVTVHGREVAASVNWQKLSSADVKVAHVQPKQVIQEVRIVESAPTTSAPEENIPAAAVQEELNLTLVEVINPSKWQNGLPSSQFSGHLSTNDGIIEELVVSLPDTEGISVSFSEMTGNVFEYDYAGDLYSGMMYQVDQNSWMVTLTNGPLEGTRLRYSNQVPEYQQEQQQEQQPVQEQEYVAQNDQQMQQEYQDQYSHQYSQHGEYTPEAMMQHDQMMQQQYQQNEGMI